MKAYSYHYETGEFAVEIELDESPLEPGVFLVPAYSTTVKPPDLTPNKVPCFINDEWVLVDDFRGTNVWDKQTQERSVIRTIGQIPINKTTLEPNDNPAKWDGVKWVKDENKFILLQIELVESTITIRRQREAILGIDNGWLANVESQISLLRTQLK